MSDKERTSVELLKASQFDVHKWSDYPEVKTIVLDVYEQLIQYRKDVNPDARITGPDEIKKHLRVLFIDLYVAAAIGHNPWRGLSKHKTDYQKKSRYRKIYLTYDYLSRLVNDLVKLGYIEEVIGYYDREINRGMRTRIRATPKLMELIEDAKHGLKSAIEKEGLLNVFIDNPEIERETVILRDENKKYKDYEDNDDTHRMRDNLRIINAKLAKARITLRLTDQQFEELEKQLAGSDDEEKHSVDFTRKQLCRIFNVDFNHGGRFYGGWWQGIPSAYRKYIEIGHKETEEVDYSGHHIRMLYAKEGLQPPDDPYDLGNGKYLRSDIKQAFLVLINADSLISGLKALAVNVKVKNAPAMVMDIQRQHKAIAKYFFTGVGLELQYEDSVMAESVMLKMVDRGAVVLPVHDSFIVRNSYKEELEEVMNEVFGEMYNASAKLKTVKSVLEVVAEERERIQMENGGVLTHFVSNNITKLIQEDRLNYKKYYSLWGN